MKKPDLGSIKPTCGQCVAYLEDSITDWRAGFAVLTYKDGRLLWPDVCHVVAPGVVEFRGTEIAV